MNKDIISYYNQRSKEYDNVYSNPLEQADLKEANIIFQDLYAKKTVLEFACGTGYWTEQISKTAKSVFATDVNESVIKIAEKRRKRSNINYAVSDMFSFNSNMKFDSFFGGFIWSHILIQDLDRFINKIKNHLNPNGKIAFIDSNYVEGTIYEKKKIIKRDEFGNTYQMRALENGTKHLVLKNFPTKEFMNQKFSGISGKIEYRKLEYYWIAVCEINL